MDDDTLTIDELLAWGLDWEERLRAGPRGQKFDFGSDWTVLEQYVIAANAALLLQREQERKKARKNPKKPGSTGGRPRGGMGDEVIRLAAHMGEQRALRFVEKKHPQSDVKRAYKAALKRAKQKTPR